MNDRIADSGVPARPVKKASVGKRLLIGLLGVLGIFGLFFFLVTKVVFSSFVVPTGSMEKTILPGDYLLVQRGGAPVRGEMIVFEFPGMRDQVKADEKQYYVERCMGMAGDTFEIRDAKVFVDGEEVSEPPTLQLDHLHPVPPDDRFRTFPSGAGFTRDNWGPMRVPKRGDRIPMNDSTYYLWEIFIRREGHAIEKSEGRIAIDGKGATSYVVERDYCIGLGDNRSNSLDSRYWGFVPVASVAGSPRYIYWSSDPISGETRWDRIFKGME